MTLVNDLTGENRRFLLRALIIAGDDDPATARLGRPSSGRC